ncbi:MAG: hypothetical protein H6Q37_556 [Chloroflexi bacterium]|jgi:hypothetical protein|nr:hypothetical protein [Chloroflexota bacterium]
MPSLPLENLKRYRSKTFRMLPGMRLQDADQAVSFVNERGFVYFWPISGITLPSLWVATAGDRPVADEHDDPGHITWGWKDGLLDQRRWYYAKILRKKATMISMEIVPFFYALTENYGAYDEDFLTQYEQGRLTIEARQVYEALLKEGPLDTVALRRVTHMTSQGSESRFNRALADLQADFKITPVAVTQAGAWHYAFAYEVTARYYPEIPEIAHPISEQSARQKLAEVYFCSVGAAQTGDLAKLFHWKISDVQSTLGRLVQNGLIQSNIEIEKQTGDWFVISDIL